jgi:hypothetical protein
VGRKGAERGGRVGAELSAGVGVGEGGGGGGEGLRNVTPQK